MAASVDPDSRTALVLYGSETGNAQDVAEEIGRLCERLRFSTHVSEVDSVSLRQLLQPDLVIFAISTTGQGDLPANAQAFWKSLRSVRLPPGCLRSLQFTSFGLGDTSYPKFNWAHRKLYNRLIQLGAQPIFDRGESDEQHPEGIDGTFIPWSLQLRQRLLDHYPLPDGIQSIPEDVFLEPKWSLDFAEQRIEGPAISNGALASHVDEPSDRPPDGLIGVPNGIEATIAFNDRATPPTHWQDVRHLVLNLSEPKIYRPGDVLTIYPKNFPADVGQLIKLMGWMPIADKQLNFVPTASQVSSSYPPPPIPAFQGKRFTLRTLLTNHLDIMAIPRRSFFNRLIHYTEDPFHIERLKEFTNPEFIDELFDYTTRPRRSILEVLDEFTSVKIPWQKICSVIPVLRGRQFSIASGGSLKSTAAPENSTRIELLVAIVKYRTVIKRTRQGVGTRYIASLQPNQNIVVTLQKGGLNPRITDVEKPVVMVGPGTGVAPMRSLIYERIAWRSELKMPQPADGQGDILFYGCRNEDKDFFFKDEWQRLAKETSLQVFAAFSRDQRQKVYVQDLVRQQSKQVYTALAEKGGMVYICGSSGKMPQAVREALIEVFQEEGSMAREDAEGYLVRMEKDGRYKQETW